MAARPRISGRITSLAHAFVHAIIPRHVDSQEQKRLLAIAGIEADKCAYCGAPATDQDHFRGLVKAGRPSGHFHTPDNLVPSCGPCNQSKGGSDWRKWIAGPARGSPTTRGIGDVPQRITRLAAFEAESKSIARTIDELRAATGAELWDRYWDKLDQIRKQLLDAEKDAELIRAKLDEAITSTPSSPLP
jgi:hypothetical protein